MRLSLALGVLAACSGASSPFAALTGAGAFAGNSFIAIYQGYALDGGVGPGLLQLQLFESFPSALTCASIDSPGGYGRAIFLTIETPDQQSAVRPGTFPILPALVGSSTDGGSATLSYLNSDAGGDEPAEASGASGQVVLTAVGPDIEGTFTAQLVPEDAGFGFAGSLSGSFRAPVCGPSF